MYIEFVIADNFLLTYLAGACAAMMCHKRANVWRLLAAATVGTVVAVFYPYMRLNAAAQLAVKLSLGIVLCVIVFLKTERPIASSLMFFGCTFAFGGANYALGLALYSSASAATAFCLKCPLFITLGTGAAVFLCARYIVGRLRAPRARAPYEYAVCVDVFGTTLRFSAFLDTGNCVFDDRSGLPVIITDAERFAAKLNESASREFLKHLHEFRKLDVSTAAGKTSAYIIKPTGVTVYSDRRGHTIEAVLGLVSGGKTSAFSAAHELLLNPAAMTEGL
ncbi:MAG: sigma-E processing peptidase SpoIIGA [Roseburia sp.]|nr:sigma-E processing peptidase SpoIIGA [Roseburia sp.]